MQDDMTVTEIQEALGELVAAMVEKGVTRPEARLILRGAGERLKIYLTASEGGLFSGADFAFAYGDNAARALAVARDKIANIPDPQAAVALEFKRKVAAAADYGRENNIDDRYVKPLRGVMADVSENLLPAPEAAE